MPQIGPRARLLFAAVVALAAAVVAIVLALSSSPSSSRPGGDRARGALESIFQDDQLLLYSPTATVAKTLDTLHALGVDRVRATVLWLAIAPDGTAAVVPHGFKASDPAAYPAAVWAPYDRLVDLARARGLGVDFNLTAPGPLWAMGRGAPSKYATHYRPSASAFGQFVAAVGKRYSGHYVPPGGSGKQLPAVNYWTIWNEPNQPGWLAPQWGQVEGARTPISPVLYRAQADAAFTALRETGHGAGTDAILIGELAPEGSESTAQASPIPPLPFLRALYCVDSSYRPLSGAAAGKLNCPSGGSASAFVDAHPALFQATGFAHHPYAFFLPPSTSMSDQNFVPLADLGRLEHSLDAIFTSYGVHRQLPIYLTEYGYETNPPNPFRGVSLARQSLYLDEAQYMAWKDPRVRAMSQFLLVDSAPDRSFKKGSLRYWSTFQTGLEFLNGAPKPSFAAYRLPVFVPAPNFRRGQSVFVWAMLRPAANGTPQHALIQWSRDAERYRTISSLSTTDPSGFVTGSVSPPGSGLLRVQWTSPAGITLHSRAVTVQQSG